MLFDRLAANLGNLPLKTAHARFASVVANDVANGFALERELALFQAIGLDLLGR
ncbi:hypothetical protein D3C86_2193010 [compost metagenome]